MAIWLKRIFIFFVSVLTVIALAVIIPSVITTLTTRAKIFDQSQSPSKPVAIVFGAGLRRDGYPTTVLRDRVKTAAQLYFDGQTEILLMSGDNSRVDYDEPSAMRDYAVSLGVPEDAIVLDYAGRRTYDTCYRAGAIFGVDDAILVTQEFHLPRALYICQQLGVDAVGVRANLYRYWERTQTFWNVRETLATMVAVWDVHISKPTPVLGEPQPIFSQEA